MIEVRRLRPQMGTEVTSVGARELADPEFDAICRAWLDSNVHVMRRQTLEVSEHLAYGRRFGLIEPHLDWNVRTRGSDGLQRKYG